MNIQINKAIVVKFTSGFKQAIIRKSGETFTVAFMKWEKFDYKCQDVMTCDSEKEARSMAWDYTN